MKRQFMTGMLLALAACGVESDPASPAPMQMEVASKGAPVDVRPAVQDALDRLIPNLAMPEAGETIGRSMRRLAASLDGGSDAEREAALMDAVASVDGYAGVAGADPDLDAVRLVVEAARAKR